MQPSFVFNQKAFIVNPHWQALVCRPITTENSNPVWDFPGGILNYKESLRSSLAWKVKNQTGLDITTVSVPLHVTTYLDWLDRSRQIVRIIYLCLAEGTLKTDASFEYQWVDPMASQKLHFPDEGYHFAFGNLNIHSQMSANDFLGSGILSDTQKYLESTPPSVNI